MEIEVDELRTLGTTTEHYVFVDSNDARFATASDAVRGDGTFVDSSKSRTLVGNPANAYTLTFADPFRNVVSVELLEAKFPSYPLRSQSKYDPTDLSKDPLRFISVRCSEVEDHLSRHGQAINWPFGLAKVTWTTLEDDFVEYKKPYLGVRKFHPIGKLYSMKFDFLKNNTDCHVLFQGFHHTMLLVITTLDPVMRIPRIVEEDIETFETPGVAVEPHPVPTEADVRGDKFALMVVLAGVAAYGGYRYYKKWGA